MRKNNVLLALAFDAGIAVLLFIGCLLHIL